MRLLKFLIIIVFSSKLSFAAASKESANGQSTPQSTQLKLLEGIPVGSDKDFAEETVTSDLGELLTAEENKRLENIRVIGKKKRLDTGDKKFVQIDWSEVTLKNQESLKEPIEKKVESTFIQKDVIESGTPIEARGDIEGLLAAAKSLMIKAERNGIKVDSVQGEKISSAQQRMKESSQEKNEKEKRNTAAHDSHRGGVDDPNLYGRDNNRHQPTSSDNISLSTPYGSSSSSKRESSPATSKNQGAYGSRDNPAYNRSQGSYQAYGPQPYGSQHNQKNAAAQETGQRSFNISMNNPAQGDQDYQNKETKRTSAADKAEAAALHKALKQAVSGDKRAQRHLGKMFETGQGVEKDLNQARHWYEKAARQGDTASQVKLGDFYETGQGVSKDEKKAAEFYRQAAHHSDAEAQIKLAKMYAKGKGVPQDEALAKRWKTQAAKEGARLKEKVAKAQTLTPEALEKLKQAAANGNAASQAALGLLYAKGAPGVEKNLDEAIKLLKKAADQGDAAAMTYLADMYAKGKGVPQDEKEAFRLNTEAAKKNTDHPARDQTEQEKQKDDRETLRRYHEAVGKEHDRFDMKFNLKEGEDIHQDDEDLLKKSKEGWKNPYYMEFDEEDARSSYPKQQDDEETTFKPSLAKTVYKACAPRIDKALKQVIAQSQAITYVNGVKTVETDCLDTAERFKMEKDYDHPDCQDFIEVKDDYNSKDKNLGLAYATFKYYWTDKEGRRHYLSDALEKEEAHPFALQEEKGNCSYQEDLKKLEAVEKREVVYYNRLKERIVWQACRPSNHSKPVAITLTSKGCSVVHQFDKNQSMPQQRHIYVVDGIERQASPCHDVSKTWLKHQFDLHACKPVVDEATKRQQPMAKRYIVLPDKGKKFIGECEPYGHQTTLLMDRAACAATPYTYDLAGRQSFLNIRYYYDRVQGRKYVTPCQPSSIAFAHKKDHVGYEHDDAKKVSKVKIEVSFMDNGKKIIVVDSKADDFEKPTPYLSKGPIVETVAYQKSMCSDKCHQEQKFKQYQLYQRPNGSEYREPVADVIKTPNLCRYEDIEKREPAFVTVQSVPEGYFYRHWKDYQNIVNGGTDISGYLWRTDRVIKGKRTIFPSNEFFDSWDNWNKHQLYFDYDLKVSYHGCGNYMRNHTPENNVYWKEGERKAYAGIGCIRNKH